MEAGFQNLEQDSCEVQIQNFRKDFDSYNEYYSNFIKPCEADLHSLRSKRKEASELLSEDEELELARLENEQKLFFLESSKKLIELFNLANQNPELVWKKRTRDNLFLTTEDYEFLIKGFPYSLSTPYQYPNSYYFLSLNIRSFKNQKQMVGVRCKLSATFNTETRVWSLDENYSSEFLEENEKQAVLKAMARIVESNNM